MDKVRKSWHSDTRHLILVTFFQAMMTFVVSRTSEKRIWPGCSPTFVICHLPSKCHRVRTRRIKTGFLIRTHKIDSEKLRVVTLVTQSELWRLPLSSAHCNTGFQEKSQLLLALISAETDIFLLKMSALWLTPGPGPGTEQSSHSIRALSQVPSPEATQGRQELRIFATHCSCALLWARSDRLMP